MELDIIRALKKVSIIINRSETESVIYFDWCIVALQYCVNFCFTTKWVSYIHTYIHISPPSRTSLVPPPTPLGHHRAPSRAPCALQLFPTCIYFTHGVVYMSVPIHPTLFRHCIHTPCSASAPVFLPCDRFICTSFLDFRIYVLISNIFLCLTYFTLYDRFQVHPRLYRWPNFVSFYFLGGASGKEPSCQCRRHKICEFDPWVGKIPWRRKWQPTPVFLPEEFHGQRSLAGYSPQTTRLSTESVHFSDSNALDHQPHTNGSNLKHIKISENIISDYRIYGFDEFSKHTQRQRWGYKNKGQSISRSNFLIKGSVVKNTSKCWVTNGKLKNICNICKRQK